jgi:hypothetical protein
MTTALVRRVLPLVILAALLGHLVRDQRTPSAFSDTWFHLRFGREFLESWSVSAPGHLTIYDTAHWIPTQWLSQEAMALVADRAGVTGVVWSASVLVMVLVGCLYVACRQSAAPLLAVACTTLATLSALPGLTARPQLVSYLFVVVTVWAWLATARDGRPRYWLVALAWLWPMCHGMWPIGISVSAAAVLGIALSRNYDRRTIVRLASVPVLSAVVACMTPVGLNAYRVLLTVGSRADVFHEWGPPDFTSPHGVLLALMLAAALVAGLSADGVDRTQTALLLVGLAWSLYSLRTMPPAALIIAPVLAALGARLFPETGLPCRSEKVAVASIVTVACAAAALVLSVRPTTEAVPAWVNHRLDAMPGGTRILNDWDSGAYFLYRHPRLQTAIHGYGEVFTDRELERNVDLSRAAPGWEELASGLDADYALVRPDTALAYGLVQQASWTILEEDDEYMLLQPPPTA